MPEFYWQNLLAAFPPAAAVFVGDETHWTAAAIIREMDALTGHLRDSRVVAVLADNGPAWAMLDLAVQDARRIHLPLPAFFTDAQLKHAITLGVADTLVTDQPERIGRLDLGFCLTGRWQGLSWMRRVVDAQDLEASRLPPGTAKISFTSGSTGAPKGVCLSAGGLLETAMAVQQRLADLNLQRHLAVLPLALLLENVTGIHAPLLGGMQVHLPSLPRIGWQGMSGFDPKALDALTRHTAPNSLTLVPELLKAWTAFLQASGGRPQASIDFVAVGGARLAPAAIAQARQCGLPAFQGYGLTEAGSVVSLNRPGDDDIGVGRPLGHADVRIDNGEVQVRTRAFLGYAGQPENFGNSGAPTGASSGTFPGELPGKSPETYAAFPTGDLGRLADNGHLHLDGRRKNLLITAFGRNVSPEWIESLLLAEPDILQAVVVGDGQAQLAALIVPRPGSATQHIDASIARINHQLPDYARLAGWSAIDAFTPANGLATGNGRPMRSRINHVHAATIAALHRSEENHHVVL